MKRLMIGLVIVIISFCIFLTIMCCLNSSSLNKKAKPEIIKKEKILTPAEKKQRIVKNTIIKYNKQLKNMENWLEISEKVLRKYESRGNLNMIFYQRKKIERSYSDIWTLKQKLQKLEKGEMQ